MNGFVVKVYMMQVKPKTLASLHSSLKSSVDDSENLVVHVEELIPTFSESDENGGGMKELVKEIVKTIDDEVKYVWFYL